MKKVICGLLVFAYALLLCSCSGEKMYTKEEWGASQSHEATKQLSISTTSGSNIRQPNETTQKKTTTKKDITVKTEEKSQNKTESPTETSAQTTQIFRTNPTTSTKPILTDDVESQLIELFVQKHSVELQDIEDRHSAAINALDKESSDFEVYYFVRVKQINEKYANMGLTGSGPHNSELRALENKRADIANRRNAEIERYKKEKDALIQLITSEMQQYIDENFTVK